MAKQCCASNNADNKQLHLQNISLQHVFCSAGTAGRMDYYSTENWHKDQNKQQNLFTG